MMNKGLEVIEAHYLFNLPSDKIEVIMHPQSIIHSSVYFNDGSTLSQLGNPDMRSVISYAMSFPKRINSGVTALDLTQNSPLEFYTPDLEKFPCLRLAFDALKQGGSAMGVINAANEIAVANFLDNKIKFLDIANIIEKTLEQSKQHIPKTLAEVLDNDKSARLLANEIVQSYV
jgi:1-deoxy-D-xylulose-5-phosphate reductoisomerase